MGQPSWREIKKLKVPEREASFWTPVLDYVAPGKLYRILVEALPAAGEQHWTPESGTKCTADGDPALPRAGALSLENCAVGALIAKIGGSTADFKPDKDKLVLFGVGRHCVFSISDAAKAGSLYLGMNDTGETAAKVQGQLEVTVFEAL
jgi:hypothetical protein